MLVVILERQPGKLLVYLFPQAVGYPLGDFSHQIMLQPVAEEPCSIHSCQEHEKPPNAGKIHPNSRLNVKALHHLSQLLLSPRPEQFNSLFFTDAAGQLLADDTFKEQIGGISKELRARHIEENAEHDQAADGGQRYPMRPQVTGQSFQRTPKSLARSPGATGLPGPPGRGPPGPMGLGGRDDSLSDPVLFVTLLHPPPAANGQFPGKPHIAALTLHAFLCRRFSLGPVR